MDFKLNEIQQEFQQTARKFFTEKCTLDFLKNTEETSSHYCEKLYGDIAELGFTGLIIPEAYGGFGGELFDLGLIVEEAGYAMMQSPLLPTVAYGIMPLLQTGNEAQKSEWLEKIAQGSLTVTGAISEKSAHYNIAYTETTAVQENAQFVVNGQKLFVPFADSADYLLTLVRTAGQVGQREGLTVLLIDRRSAGVDVKPIPTISTNGLCEVNFQQVHVPSSQLIGQINEGALVIDQANDVAVALQNIETAGILRRAVDLTVAYVKDRHQFNVPIANFQSVQHRMADMFTIAEGGRLAAYSAYSKLANNQPYEKELAVAKAWLSSEGTKVVTGAHQLHGGMGLDYDYPLQFAFRRYKASQLLLGTAETHLKTISKQFDTASQEKVPTV